VDLKACNVRVKSTPAATDGVFEAIVSVFGNVDHVGDVVQPGAFAATLAEWKASGDSIPIFWSHRMDDPQFCIGKVLDAEELAPNDPRIPDWADPWIAAHGGLWVKGQIDTGPDASNVAKQTRRLLADRRVTQFSYAYDVIDAGPCVVDGQDAWELRELKLFEISPTPIGCNDRTELLAAKSRARRGVKAAGVVDPALASLIGQADQAIDDAVSAVGAADLALDGVMSALGLADVADDDATDAQPASLSGTASHADVRAATGAVNGNANDDTPVNDEEPARVKSEELARNAAESFRAMDGLLLLESEFAS
jgi:phage head maturation protease